MNEELTFNNLLPDGYYFGVAAHYDGYGGFDFSAMTLISRAAIEHYDLQDTGYGNALHGNGEAIVAGQLSRYSYYANFYVPNPSTSWHTTFNLRSAIFAAAKPDGSPRYDVEIMSFSQRGIVKDNINLKVSATARTVNFSHYGAGFDDISYIKIYSFFAMMVMDNVKVHWDSKAPGQGPSEPSLRFQDHSAQHRPHIAQMLLLNHVHEHYDNAGGESLSYVQHGELASLAAALGHAGPGHGLTGQFFLPHCEHFGT